MLLIGFASLTLTCTKTAALKTEIANSKERNSGLQADDPILVAKAPLIMSGAVINNRTIIKDKPYDGANKRKVVDNTAPTVSIISPAPGAQVSGIVIISVTASDNVGVASVSASVDGSVIGTITTAPYNFTWDAASAASGTHAISATAKDAKGNSATTTISVSVSAPPPPPPPPPPDLPASIRLDTPVPGNQGNEGSCTAFADVYNARSIEQYYRTGATSYSTTTNIFSPEYVYDQTKTTCSGGTSLTSCLDLMYYKGVCLEATMPYSDVNGCNVIPTAAQDAEAANYKISGYSRMVNTDIIAIKTSLYYKHPVMVGITVDNAFVSAGPGFIWNFNTTSDGQVGHSVCLIGYDDSKHAYLVVSSWGTSWGDGGYTWVDYDFFPTKAGFYLYVIN